MQSALCTWPMVYRVHGIAYFCPSTMRVIESFKTSPRKNRIQHVLRDAKGKRPFANVRARASLKGISLIPFAFAQSIIRVRYR